jgi:adenylate cyclase
MVADSLKAGTNGAVVARNESLFTEVNTIGHDFETIVVDYLGFSSDKARDSTHAPKDPTKPFVVVFTDIESSSLLWGRDAVEMARCLRHHHEIIRDLLRTHHLYEVKTVGDSFMATTASATDAVNFAVALEEALFAFQWDWPEAEEVYQQAHHLFRKTQGEDGAYEDLWNGLRVRVGIHHGVGDIVFDEVARGYDYYGQK